MKMCRKCYDGQKAQGGYLCSEDTIVKQAECSIHPRMDNWRVARTIKTLLTWGLSGEGSKIGVGHPGSFGIARVTICLEDGWVHLRNAKAKLFDYEVPFVKLLLKEGMLEKRECKRYINGVEPTAVRVTTKGRVWLREIELKIEAEKAVAAKIEAEKAMAGV